MSAPVDVRAAPCPRCGTPTAVADRFCEVCGTDLQGDLTDTPPVGMPAAAPDPAEHVEVVTDGGAAVSDRGHVRARNEDAVALGRAPVDGPGPVAAVVCDGVGSVRDSELAARAAADATLAGLLRDGTEHDGEPRTRAAVAAGAAAAANLVPAGTRNPPSSTLVCGLVDLSDPTAPQLTVAWVGDSRAYWLAGRSGGPARLLTADHVAAAEPPGVLDPLVVATRPDAITRWVGGDSAAEPDVVTLAPTGPGVLLLCTDGLWKYFPDADALAALALPALYEGGAPTAAAALTAAALEAGGEDNVTVAVLPVWPIPPAVPSEGATVPVARSSP